MSFLSDMIGVGSSILSSIPGIGQVAGGMLNGINNAIGGYANTISARDEAKKVRDFNAQEAQKNRDFQTSEREAAQEFNLEMWNMNNEYNSPAEQLKRLQAAGINPNSMLGQGTTAANPISTSPMNGATASASDSLSAGLLNQNAVLKNLLSTADNQQSQADSNKYGLSFDILSQPYRLEAMKIGNQLASKQIDKLLSDINATSIDNAVKIGMFEWYSKLSEQDIKIKEQQLNLMRNQSLELLERVKLVKAQTKKENASTQLILEQANTELYKQDLLENQSNLAFNQSLNVEEDTIGKELSNDLLRLQKEFSAVTGIPYGTDQFNTMFYLYSKGRMWDYYNIIATQGLQALSTSIGNSPTKMFSSAKNPR